MTLRLLHLEKLGLPDIDDKETLILTPNNRIMRKFLASYEQLQLEHGKQAWNTPNVHPISTWIHNQALECQDMGCELISDSQILNPEQEMVLWQRIASNAKKIAMESNENYIGKVGHVAKTAQQAHSLMEMWDIDFNNSQFEHSPEAERFRQWAIEFESTCKIKGLITSSSLPKIIIQAIKHGYITPPKNIVLFAFDDIAPVYQDMFDAFSSTGSSITKTEPFVKNISTQRVSLHDADEEIGLSALWAKKIIEDNKDAVIGIVVPELTQLRNTVLRHFADVFEPRSIMPDEPRYTLPFNISAGVSFSSLPIIMDAFKMLSMEKKFLKIEDAIAIVRSPFISHSVDEFSTRSILEGKLKRFRKSVVSIDEVIQASDRCPQLIKAFQSFFSTETSREGKLPSQWAYSLNEKLKSIGWPGQRNLDSEEYQAVSHWTAALDKMGQMDMLGNISYSRSVDLLKNLASSSVFQPKMDDSPIQILGSLEAAGLQFSHLWVMGLHDSLWPAVAKPNPYLPLPLQRNPGFMENGGKRLSNYRYFKKVFPTS